MPIKIIPPKIINKQQQKKFELIIKKIKLKVRKNIYKREYTNESLSLDWFSMYIFLFKIKLYLHVKLFYPYIHTHIHFVYRSLIQ